MSRPDAEFTDGLGGGVIAEVLGSALWKEARKRANRSNSRKLRRQPRWAVKEDRYVWDWRVPEKGQDAHHIVLSGDIDAREARKHMESLGISVNSVFNGVGLPDYVHRVIHSPKSRYTEVISKAIRRFRTREEAVEFLDDVARDLSGLNQYAGNKLKLESEFEAFLVSIEEIGR